MIEKYCDNGSILWWLKNVVIMDQYCDDWNIVMMEKYFNHKKIL